MNTQKVDFAIVGGGVTGLWLNVLLARAGFSTIVIEKTALGVQQTLASQGMIPAPNQRPRFGVPRLQSKPFWEVTDLSEGQQNSVKLLEKN